MEHQAYERIVEKTLDRLCEGEGGTILEIPTDHPLAGRLGDMGWLVGSEVRCVHKGPSGDPVAYRVAGGTVALRLCDAERIRVSVMEELYNDDETYEELLPDGCIYGAYGDYGSEDDVGNLLEGGDTYETAR